MVKKSQQKTRHSLLLIGTSSVLTLICLTGYILHPYISASLLLNTLPLLSSITSSTTQSAQPFYGENIDMSQILPTSQYYVVNSKGQDLIDIAAQLGINLIRITNAQPSFDNNADSIYSGKQWDQVLDKMQKKGIKALILIETASGNNNYYTPNIQQIYLNLVQAYIDSGVFSHPDVYGVDINNEPLLTDANIHMLQKAHAMIKAQYPHLKQTIGWWATETQGTDISNRASYNWSDYAADQKIASIVDFYSIHMYGLDTSSVGVDFGSNLKTKVFVSEIENGLQTQKPILIEEFGEANGDAVSDQDTIGSPQLQANIYQGVYQALKEMHSSQVLGAVAFDFYSRDQYPDAWAIVKDHGNYLFPAAYILQEYASGKNNPSLQGVTVVTSQSYLVTNVDDGITQSLHISDRIGLKIKLDASANYALLLSGDGILRPLDALRYNPVADAYYALYQAVRKGSVQLTIMRDGNTVYTITITIQ